MTINFDICLNDFGIVNIIGNEQKYNLYNDFSYEDSVTINILIPISSVLEEGNPIIDINEHTSEDDVSLITIPKDGLYKVMHIILPKKRWVENNEKNSKYILKYYYHNNEVYIRLFGNSTNKVNILTVLSHLNSTANTTISYDTLMLFSTSNLNSCYYTKAINHLNKAIYCPSKQDFELEILLLGMHTIKYLVDLDRMYEALKLIETLEGCGGICKNNLRYNGCGC